MQRRTMRTILGLAKIGDNKTKSRMIHKGEMAGIYLHSTLKNLNIKAIGMDPVTGDAERKTKIRVVGSSKAEEYLDNETANTFDRNNNRIRIEKRN